MKQKTNLTQQRIMTEEEEIMNDPEMMTAIKEDEEAQRKGIKPWKIKY